MAQCGQSLDLHGLLSGIVTVVSDGAVDRSDPIGRDGHTVARADLPT